MTATPTLAQYLEGDLGVARRHLARIRSGLLAPSDALLNEISESIERCVQRIRRDVLPQDPGPDPAAE